MRFISYAQNFEDVMLRRALSEVENGFYIDIGAADPVEMSVTKAFYDAGWRGINAEPTPRYFDRLRAARPRDVNLQVAVGRADGERTFYAIESTGLSTLQAEIAAGHQARGWQVQECQVATLTLAEICQRHARGPIHFLKIDVEGSEAEVLAGADFERYRPWIVVLEATRPLTNQPAASWESQLLAVAYEFVWFDGLNRFYIASEHNSLRHAFELPPNCFDEFDIYDFKSEQFRAERVSAERELQGRLNEIRLLCGEVSLRRRSQARVAEEFARVRHLADQAAAELDNVRRDLAACQHQLSLAVAREHRNWQVLTRLACELRWEEAPRALRIVLPLARLLRRLFGRAGTRSTAEVGGGARIAPAADVKPAVPVPGSAPAPGTGGPATPVATPTRQVSARRAVHQFHPGSAYGDAVTKSMLLTRKILRGLGYRSEIYVDQRDEALADELLLLDDLPTHGDYVLIVLHSLGYARLARIAALPAPKVLMYHNITPANFLRGIPALAALADVGREQLREWRGVVAAALAVSPYNALELRRHDYANVGICPLLFDVAALRDGARPGQGRDANDPLTVLFVGRVVESKGQIDLVDAFDLFRRRYRHPCRLVLVGRYESGGDAYAEALFERVGGHGMRQLVEITGQITDAEVSAWYDRADLYVSVSQHEGFGVPLIEAMAHDVPVIAYGAGAVPGTMSAEAPDPRTVLASRAPADVSGAMLAVVENPAFRTEIIARQRRNLDRFRLERHVPVLVQALLRAGAAGPRVAGEPPSPLQFTVTGHVNGTYSLAAVNRTMALALDRVVPGRTRVRPVETEPTAFLGGVPANDQAAMARLAAMPAPASGPMVVISQHYPVYVPDPECSRDGLTLAFFFWEESLVPAPTIALLNRCFDAVLAPSRFVAKVLLDSGLSIPTRVVGYAPRLESFTRIGAASRVARETFTFLHVSSAFPRKGVDVLLAAYAEAFSGLDKVRLVLKVFPNPHNETAAQIAALRGARADLPAIELIDQDIGDAEMLGLFQDADALILPTRGEGFNLPAAEALAAGLPLVVTGAGGHLDFVTSEEAMLIPWTAEVSRSHFANGVSLWFEPDKAALARAMRALVADPAAARTRARAARETVARRLDGTCWANRIVNAAAEILAASEIPPLRYGFVSSWGVRCGVAEYTRQLAAIFETLAAPGHLAVFCDDRAAACHEAAVRVVPCWSQGTNEVERLAAAISREDPDVVLIQHQPGLLSWLGLEALLRDPRIRARQVVVTLHATLHMTALPADERAVVVAALSSAARVVVHRLADVRFLAAEGLSTNVVMIPQGVPTIAALPAARDPRRRDAPVIGTYGFLLPTKGLRGLIAALPLIRQTWPGATLRMVNALHDAPESLAELQACQELATTLGVSEPIEWHTDFLPDLASIALLQECDVIVLPYRETLESSSAALRSCLASGTPVVVTPQSIFDEADDAVTRLNGGAPDDIAAGVIALLEDATARRSMQAAAARWVGERSWETVGRRLHGMTTGLVVNAGRLTTSASPASSALDFARIAAAE